MPRPGIEIDLKAHWELLQRGIYRRDVQLALYYEVERLGKLLSETQDKLEELEKANA